MATEEQMEEPAATRLLQGTMFNLGLGKGATARNPKKVKKEQIVTPEKEEQATPVATGALRDKLNRRNKNGNIYG